MMSRWRRRAEQQDFGLNTARLRRVRLIVLAVLAVPILLLALLVVRFVSMPLTQAWHDSAYGDGSYTTAIERLVPVERLNWFEPYLPHLTKGTDLLQDGQNAEAEAELREALSVWESGSDLNQPMHAMCKIRNNLAIAIERQADELEDAKAAGDRYYEAEEILAPCASGGGGSGSDGGGGGGNEDPDTTEGNDERIKDKREKADEESGTEREEPGGGAPPDPGDPTRSDPEGSESPKPSPTPGPSTDDSKDDEVKERNGESQGGEDGGEDSGDPGEPTQPW